jgi:hypothetical protein
MTAPSPLRRDPVPGYDLTPPSDADARAMLLRVFGDDRSKGVWADACRAARIDAGRVDSTDKLRRVAAALAQQGGAAATIARSIEIRLRTYARLAARTGAIA